MVVMLKVFLVSFVGMKVDEDSAVIMKALERRGIESRSVCWDDPSIDWSEPDLCIIKSASNYIFDQKAFTQWTKTVEKTTPLWNNSRLFKWNHDKHYLQDLEQKGIPMPPSIFVSMKSKDNPSEILLNTEWSDIVIKPTISCGSFGLKRFKADSKEAEQYLTELTTEGYVQEFMGDTITMSACDAIIQPFIPEIINGEVSLFYFGGLFSHAVIKIAKTGDFRSHSIWGASVLQHNPSMEELNVCDSIFNVIEPVEYARIDLVNTSNGPQVIEVELIEPFLFFDLSPEAAENFVDHIEKSLNK